MDEMRDGDAMTALQSFLRADELLSSVSEDAYVDDTETGLLARARADTASNIGICHKQLGNLPAAVQFLQRALRLFESDPEADRRALVSAHLNLSACFSAASAPSQALQHAQAAVDNGGLLIAGAGGAGDSSGSRAPGAEASVSVTDLGDGGAGVVDGAAGSLGATGSLASGGISAQEATPDDYAMLAVAYHKVAEAREGLKDWGAACFAYSQSYEVVRWSFGPNHRLTRAFQSSPRCPRRAKTPDVGGGWGGQARARRLPGIPRSCNRRPASVQVDPADYFLGPDRMPSWPPKQVSREEHLWYSYAEHHSAQERDRLHAALERARAAGGLANAGASLQSPSLRRPAPPTSGASSPASNARGALRPQPPLSARQSRPGSAGGRSSGGGACGSVYAAAAVPALRIPGRLGSGGMR
eukprot:TRINITY_DN6899_c0_g1_i2.p2 TRINITY_DN6899_c0_g1~~TRINITY_DN6899_c0_g1_i2.p2  ORF type:complete len:414 (+),score=109.65 TRINITY_DN6899_c0_g1_i2:2839-4080(+)